MSHIKSTVLIIDNGKLAETLRLLNLLDVCSQRNVALRCFACLRITIFFKKKLDIWIVLKALTSFVSQSLGFALIQPHKYAKEIWVTCSVPHLRVEQDSSSTFKTKKICGKVQAFESLLTSSELKVHLDMRVASVLRKHLVFYYWNYDFVVTCW